MDFIMVDVTDHVSAFGEKRGLRGRQIHNLLIG
jgi:hypothetical protein